MFNDLRPYPEYMSSDLPWASELPAHWAVHRGKAIFRRMERRVRDEDGVVTCFRDGRVMLRARRRTTGFTNALQEIGYQGIRRGDLVIHAMDAFAGAVGVSEDDGKSTPVYAVCQPRGQGSTHYYAYVVRQLARSGWILANAKGIRERSTEYRWVNFAEELLPAPPAAEQEAIVTYLAHAHDRIDQAIATKRRLVALLRESRAQIIEKAIIEGGGDAERRRLKTVLSHIDQGVSPQAEAVLPGAGEWGVMKTGCVNDGVFRETESKRLPNEFKVPVEHRISVGDVLVSRASGSPRLVGSTARVTNLSLQLILSDKIFRLVPSDGLIDPEYLVRSMNAPLYRVQVLDAISGANGLANNLPRSRLREIRIPLPSIAEQREIVARIDAQTTLVNRQLNLATREVDLLEEFRKRLTADVVTGQLDVRNAAKKLQPVDPMEVVAMASATDDEDGEGGFADDEQEDE